MCSISNRFLIENMKKAYLIILFFLCVCYTSCRKEPIEAERSTIVVLFENDVHCAIDGYTKLAGLRDAIDDTAYVAVVSSGDFVQGATVGAISQGQFIIDIMNTVGYDAVTLGNHEFDYQVPRLLELTESLNAPVVCCNLYGRDDFRIFSPYVIKTYGTKRIAFVGVLTPDTELTQQYAFYNPLGTQIYDLRKDTYTELVQQAVTEARAEGADYVILLSHLGERIPESIYNSNDLIANTTGIDVVLDAHTHSVIDTVLDNAIGKPVRLCQTRKKFANIGELVITKDGTITTKIIPTTEIHYTNPEVTAATERVKAMVDALAGEVIFHSDVPLLVADVNGIPLSWMAETNAGDLVADAMRHELDADIALINGGSMRTNLEPGDVKLFHVIDMLPYDDRVWKIEATGAQILQVLQNGISLLPNENGDFVQVSGLKYTATVSNHSLSGVQIQRSDGTYEPIDPERTYLVAVLDYCVVGDGFQDVFNECNVVLSSSVLYCDLFTNYVLHTLHGNVGVEYALPQGRIMIMD